ncbi:magnesium transporter MgtE N-terminal domain-containing protein [Janibacter sp. G56]|uniref:magnesium transporter MgtE N-terminal domain-containing protein n=1 Tax=Janibacter sp. G56 TaxID=3418717 RepID=UPI003CFC13C9
MSAPSRFFVARLASLNVFDPLGDQVGRVRDVVVTFRVGKQPQVIGLVVEVPGRRRVFVPMTRVTSVDGGQVITTGLVNMRRFEQRTNETLVLAELLERRVTARTPEGEVTEATVEDIGVEQQRNRNWQVTRVFCRKDSPKSSLSVLSRRRGETFTAVIEDVTGLHEEHAPQSATRLLEAYEDLKAADLADVIVDLDPKRRAEVAAALHDDKLADVLEELPEDDQVEILSGLGQDRAADVLEAMEPDDAADLLSELTEAHREILLQMMAPDDAAPLRRLLTYHEDTAGGLMTTEPIILGPEASVAEALAVVRREEISPAIAAAVYVCRPPLETPTGKYLGLIHIQRLLREPPHASVGGFLDKDIDPLTVDAPLDAITRMLATYNFVSVPVVDDDGRLLGAVTVDDVLDHILPDDWREERHEVTHD